MKRFLSLLLMLVLLTGTASAELFEPADASEAWLLALDCLAISGFGAEYDSDTEKITRWEEPIRIHASGERTQEDVQALNGFIEELALRCPELPEISFVETEDEANLRIRYCLLEDMAEHVDGYVEGNWGFFTYWYDDYMRDYAEIAVSCDVPDQLQRNHILLEELVGALGLSNDHYLYADSIVYAPWTEVQSLSEVDWLMLNMLYDPRLSCGMEYEEARQILLG